MPLDVRIRKGNTLFRTRQRDVEDTLAQLIHDDSQEVAATAIQLVDLVHGCHELLVLGIHRGHSQIQARGLRMLPWWSNTSGENSAPTAPNGTRARQAAVATPSQIIRARRESDRLFFGAPDMAARSSSDPRPSN